MSKTPPEIETDNGPKTTDYQLEVAAGQKDAVRLDKYIAMFIENATRTKVQDAIKSGYVLVNGKKEKPSYVVQAGDHIAISLPKPPPPEAVPENIPINVVYEDESLLVVNKPAGMVVHPAFGNWTGTLVNGLLYHVDQLAEVDEERIRPGIVHRLDKDTSGLLVVAKNQHVHARLSRQFAKHDTERSYWAIVWGKPDAEGSISGNIGRSPRDRKRMTVVPEGSGKKAVTHYRVLEYFENLALVEIRLETGRTHQIRVHFAHIGHPVFADPAYGGTGLRYGQTTGAWKKNIEKMIKELGRQCLHAKTLGFVHPVSRETLRFDSDLPADFDKVLQTLRMRQKE